MKNNKSNKIRRYLGNKVLIIVFLTLLIVATIDTYAVIFPSYNTEQDCRGCHGNDSSTTIPTPAQRHHSLVANGTFQCMDCHPMLYNSTTQSYSPQLIRDCLTCHIAKNHTGVHHRLASQNLFVCSDCHPMLYDNISQSYYPYVTWNCPVCHSKVLSIQNMTSIPPPITTSPNIISYTPSSPVRDTIGSARNFGITTDQIVNVSWFIENDQVQYNENVLSASYTNTSTSVGTRNVSAVASNPNGTVKFTWTWEVTSSPPPASITEKWPDSPVYNYVGESRKFGITIDQIADITWFINGSQVQSNTGVMGSSYTSNSILGISNVSVLITNSNGSISDSWAWNVIPDSRPITIIDPGTGQNGWYRIINLNATDPDGIKYTNYSIDGDIERSNPGSGTNLITPIISLSDGTHTIRYYSVDNLNNIEANKTQTVSVDNTTPQITIISPVNGSSYTMNQILIANWSAYDTSSGIYTAIGTYQSGSNINTSSPGTKYFNVSATDNAGNTKTNNIKYYIRYIFGGYLQPINNDGSSAFKLGSNVPIKFQLTDANGNWVTNAVATLNIIKISTLTPGIYLEPYVTGPTSSGYVFTYNGTGHFYMYNLGTKNLTTGLWRLTSNIDDGTSYPVNVTIKK